MSSDEVTALADCVKILLDDIRQKQTRSAESLAGVATNLVGDEQAQHDAVPVVSGSIAQRPHDDIE